MTPAKYKEYCAKVGGQREVARKLGRSVQCIHRRCQGLDTIPREAQIAILCLTDGFRTEQSLRRMTDPWWVMGRKTKKAKRAARRRTRLEKLRQLAAQAAAPPPPPQEEARWEW